jgi:subtilisin family serine protease
VPSYVPGGGTMKMSGTSMASPNVCNTAAKLFTLEPELTPAEARELIEKGADPNPDHPEILLLNPKKSAELLKG